MTFEVRARDEKFLAVAWEKSKWVPNTVEILFDDDPVLKGVMVYLMVQFHRVEHKIMAIQFIPTKESDWKIPRNALRFSLSTLILRAGDKIAQKQIPLTREEQKRVGKGFFKIEGDDGYFPTIGQISPRFRKVAKAFLDTPSGKDPVEHVMSELCLKSLDSARVYIAQAKSAGALRVEEKISAVSEREELKLEHVSESAGVSSNPFVKQGHVMEWMESVKVLHPGVDLTKGVRVSNVRNKDLVSNQASESSPKERRSNSTGRGKGVGKRAQS